MPSSLTYEAHLPDSALGHPCVDHSASDWAVTDVLNVMKSSGVAPWSSLSVMFPYGPYLRIRKVSVQPVIGDLFRPSDPERLSASCLLRLSWRTMGRLGSRLLFLFSFLRFHYSHNREVSHTARCTQFSGYGQAHSILQLFLLMR